MPNLTWGRERAGAWVLPPAPETTVLHFAGKPGTRE